MVITRVVRDVAYHLRFRASEWVFATILGAFSYRLLLPGSTFSSSPSYIYMASWMTEMHWGACIGTVAFVRLCALTLNGTFEWFRPYSALTRSITAWLSGAVWFCLTVSFYVSNPAATGWGTYLIIFIADVSLSVAIAGEIKTTWRLKYHASAGGR